MDLVPANASESLFLISLNESSDYANSLIGPAHAPLGLEGIGNESAVHGR
jgi:hypothetical protein